MIPLGNRVFIRPETEDFTSGGIIRCRMGRQMPERGTVTAISAKAAKDTGLKVGDRVFFRKQLQLLSEDEQSTYIYANEVLAVLT